MRLFDGQRLAKLIIIKSKAHLLDESGFVVDDEEFGFGHNLLIGCKLQVPCCKLQKPATWDMQHIISLIIETLMRKLWLQSMAADIQLIYFQQLLMDMIQFHINLLL